MEVADENKFVMKEAQIMKGLNQVKSRRALGDIGNLVGALSVSCNVSKTSIGKEMIELPSKQQPCPDARALTRTFSANFQQAGGGEQEETNGGLGTWKAKQRRTNATRKPRVALSAQAAASTKVAATDSTSTSVALNALNATCYKTKQSDEKGWTLTALLTSRSEQAAADAEMQDVEDACLSKMSIEECINGNQLAVVDYVEDIYAFYRKAEVLNAVSGDYMACQTDVNAKMRSILVDWLIEVHLKFKLRPETLFLTVNVIDRFLSLKRIPRKDLQLIGVTAMLVSSKYEEVWAPEVDHFVYISDNAFSRDEVLDMEKAMLNTISFNLTVPTPYVFAMRFLKAAVSDCEMNHLVFFLVELCLVEYRMVKYPPSLLAAAAIFTAHSALNKLPLWSNALQRHSGYSTRQLMECATLMADFHKNAAQGSLTVVHKKYSCSKFNGVALLCPAII